MKVFFKTKPVDKVVKQLLGSPKKIPLTNIDLYIPQDKQNSLNVQYNRHMVIKKNVTFISEKNIIKKIYELRSKLLSIIFMNLSKTPTPPPSINFFLKKQHKTCLQRPDTDCMNPAGKSVTL